MKIDYPLKFKPILKDKVWGGTKLKSLLKKNSNSENLGESWEISGVEENVSVVANGNLKGRSLMYLLETYKETLVGKHVYERFPNKFPLLFKFIDAKEDLSVQLHPNDELAKQRHNSFGKTEMWYILNADKDSHLILGFKEEINKAHYQQHLKSQTLENILHYEKVDEGDVFYIIPGKVHAIGAGVLLAEIQQTSDITYRVYDWNRPDIDGKLRELHIDLALDAINFSIKNSAKITYETTKNKPSNLLDSPYFSVNILDVDKSVNRDLASLDSFVVYMCVGGEAIVKTENFSETVKIGETVLIPACCDSIQIISSASKLLEIYVPHTN